MVNNDIDELVLSNNHSPTWYTMRYQLYTYDNMSSLSHILYLFNNMSYLSYVLSLFSLTFSEHNINFKQLKISNKI